jgi:uncharacterized membrane protein
MFLLLVARLFHIMLGVFWVGTMVFNTIFLGPAMAEAGPDGAKVMGGIIRRRFMDVMPVVALLTIVSGLWLLWRISGGFDPHWMRTGVGHAYGAGGVLAIIGFAVGITVVRPAMKNIGRLAASAQQEPDAAKRHATMTEVAGLRRRAAAAGWIVSVLLALATAAMAVARYV